MHACLICQHSQMFGQPERLLASDTISLGFECIGPPLQGAYGLEHAPHTMIFWPETMTVNVDGGQSIPNGGCEGYIYRPAAVACDAVCQQPKQAEKTSRGCGENVDQEQLILELNKELLEALKAFDRMYVSDIPHDHRDFKVVMKARAVIERANNILGAEVS
ncbi:hypothetical protein HW932_21085 [Allochromatium humboldtianum]|uniref:Uncharacterized protein n=1 Tax=Allochromatium humboldtianum TaxID=504901 RepID=A0A850RFD4_9GAMM|nr:hypothetical protein [Allochromatium humboldtianum]NVZ11745.1 hypothetical protein [Allochromatium humboldtianum]